MAALSLGYIGHMRNKICAAASLFLTLTLAIASHSFDADFAGKTMRLDFYHTGNSSQEYISLDRTVIEGPWPGSRTQLIDQSNLGKYLFEVVDAATSRTLYSQGFSSIYGEWETTTEAKQGIMKTYPEGLRFPEPRRPVQIRLKKRGPRQTFQEIWSTRIDPNSRFVLRPPLSSQALLVSRRNGPPSEQVDLLLLADGYTVEERGDFESDVACFEKELFSVEPFTSRRKDFSIRAIFVPSVQSGVSRPRAGVFRDSTLGSSYNSLDSERYILTVEDRKWRDIAAAVPYDSWLFWSTSRSMEAVASTSSMPLPLRARSSVPTCSSMSWATVLPLSRMNTTPPMWPTRISSHLVPNLGSPTSPRFWILRD